MTRHIAKYHMTKNKQNGKKNKEADKEDKENKNTPTQQSFPFSESRKCRLYRIETKRAGSQSQAGVLITSVCAGTLPVLGSVA